MEDENPYASLDEAPAAVPVAARRDRPWVRKILMYSIAFALLTPSLLLGLFVSVKLTTWNILPWACTIPIVFLVLLPASLLLAKIDGCLSPPCNPLNQMKDA